MNGMSTTTNLLLGGLQRRTGLIKPGLLLAGALSFCAASAAPFEAYVIRHATAPPNDPPVIQVNNAYVPGATEFIIAAGGQKAGLGSSDIDGSTLGSIANLSIVRLDDLTRFTAGSGPSVAPYLNFWITDGLGHYAVVANEPSDPAFQSLFAAGYNLTWADLANKVAKVYENSDLSWLPAAGSSGLPAQAGRQNPLSVNLYTFADLAGFIIKAPTVTELTVGWLGLGGGAPRELSTKKAWGVNWIFGDTLANYVSGAEGYVVANASVSAPAPTAQNFTVTVTQMGGALNNLIGVAGDAAPGFPGGSFAADASGKSELYFDPTVLFGRTVGLGEVKNMSYWTKKGSTHNTPATAGDWFLAIYTKPFAGDVSTPAWYGSRIGSEPYFSINLADPANTWNQWTTDGANNQLRFFESTEGASGANFGSYTDPNLAAFLVGNSLGTTVPRRNQDVLWFSIQTGSAWANGFNGQLDGFKIELANGSVATVNFEPDDTQPPVASDTTVTPGTVAVTSLVNPITVTALIDDTLTGGSNIKSAEFNVNGGLVWYPMTTTDPAFDSASESVTATFTLAGVGISIPGVYSVCVRGTDTPDNVSNEDCSLLAVYDPSAGFVTGGGWIDSPAGAFVGPYALQTKWDQGFSVDTVGWFDNDIAGWEGYGVITSLGNGTAKVEGWLDADGKYYGPFSRFDGYHSIWPGTWLAEIDIYLDPLAMTAGEGFDYSVAVTGSDGDHQRDYIFHVTKDTATGKLLVAGSNNTNFEPREDLENINNYEVTAAGWYTLQHRFYDAGGYLAVDLNVLNALGQVVFTETRSTVADTIPGEVGGNRYAWFTHVTVAGGIVVDNHQRLEYGPTYPTGKANFGFVSKYKKGATVPDGSTEFVFNAGNLNFHSSTYQWLVVNNSGQNAQFKGDGTINGVGDYGFMISGFDGAKTAEPDTFRIQIWDKEDGDSVVYDNGVAQALGGGNIMVHTSKK